MTLRDLAPWLYEQLHFQEIFRQLIRDAVSDEFAHVLLPAQLPLERPLEWDYLLFAASLFSARDEGIYQDAALRIAVRCLRTPGIETKYADAAGVVLDALANVPAMQLAVRRHLLAAGLEDRLPIAARLDWVRRQYINRVTTSEGSDLVVNPFQRKLWDAVNEYRWVSFTAPTSAGKSFLLTHWVVDVLRRRPRSNIAYVVPTRALISEVEAKFKEILAHAADVRARVLSLPVRALMAPEGGTILVVTQERLHLMMTDGAAATPQRLPLDVLVIDEAHKIGDRHRGVLLQQVLERAVLENAGLQVVFASPSTTNPEVLIRDAPIDVSRLALSSSEVTVSQNLLWVSSQGDPKEWRVDLQWGGEAHPLGTIELPFSPGTETKKLAFVAHAMGDRLGANVLYVNGPAEAERVARLLYDLRAPENQLLGREAEDHENADELARLNPGLRDLVDLTQRTIHRRFALATTLKRGVAFHYGNLPLLIREEVERLFREGAIDYLVCTSTLVEGVNTACRSIFVRGPRRGRNVRMTHDDFWNLAGRAGRWGREFQGNVVCIDPTVERLWGPEGAPRERQTHNIERAAERVLGNPDRLLEFINAGTPRIEAGRAQDLEYTFAYLAALYVTHGDLGSAHWANRLPRMDLDRVEGAVARALDGIEIPPAVIRRNPGISPVAMQGLLRYFRNRTKPIDELVPIDPTDERAARHYTAIFGRIYRHLNTKLGPSARLFPLAILVTDWMRGRPLGALISGRERRERDKAQRTGRPAPQLAATIRAVMEDVEQIARFEAPRSLAAYLDVLRIYLQETERSELLANAPDVSLFLELGVNQVTQISLMALGLSRTSTLALSELIANDHLDRAQAKRWLETSQWEDADLPVLVKREVQRLLMPPAQEGDNQALDALRLPRPNGG